MFLGFQKYTEGFVNCYGGIAGSGYSTFHGTRQVLEILDSGVVRSGPNYVGDKFGVYSTKEPRRAMSYAKEFMLGAHRYRGMFQLHLKSANKCKDWEYTKDCVVEDAITIESVLLVLAHHVSDIGV
jgi:hypothetical protein